MTTQSLADTLQLTDIGITIDNHVAVVEIQKGPNNFFDTTMINDLADAFEQMDKTDEVRAIVLCSEGKHFCAGNDFSSAARNEERADRDPKAGNPLYAAAVRLFATETPVIAAVQGAAVGAVRVSAHQGDLPAISRPSLGHLSPSHARSRPLSPTLARSHTLSHPPLSPSR